MPKGRGLPGPPGIAQVRPGGFGIGETAPESGAKEALHPDAPGALALKLASRAAITPPREPLFKGEGHPRGAFKHNQRWAVEGPWQTPLAAPQEERFQDWAKRFESQQGIKVNKEYDYRGWWKNATPRERHLAIAEGGHFTDKYKTPFDTSFSNQSKYAKPGTPLVWRKNAKGKNVLVNKNNGRLIVRESEE